MRLPYRVGLAAVVSAALVLGFWVAKAPRATPVREGDLAPDFDLPSVYDSGRDSLSRLRGSPVLFVLFDTRWPRSQAYMRQLERMHRRYLQQGLVVLAVALDDDTAILRAVLPSITFPMLADPGGKAIAQTWGRPHGETPETYLIAPGGRVAHVFLEPPDWTASANRRVLESLMPSRSTTAPR